MDGCQTSAPERLRRCVSRKKSVALPGASKLPQPSLMSMQACGLVPFAEQTAVERADGEKSVPWEENVEALPRPDLLDVADEQMISSK
eukprot:6604991-Prymnesium_polylepis.1